MWAMGHFSLVRDTCIHDGAVAGRCCHPTHLTLCKRGFSSFSCQAPAPRPARRHPAAWKRTRPMRHNADLSDKMKHRNIRIRMTVWFKPYPAPAMPPPPPPTECTTTHAWGVRSFRPSSCSMHDPRRGSAILRTLGVCADFISVWYSAQKQKKTHSRN
jgi:hypothetical protein